MMTEINASLYSKKTNKLNIALNVLIAVIALALLFEIIFAATYSGIYVVGSSMNNTLTGAESETTPGGDYVYVNKHARPDYGDIVVIFEDNGKTIIKRVVAFGGDRIKLVQGKLYVKYSGTEEFELVEEVYVSPENNNPSYNNFPDPNKVENAEDGYLVEKDCLFLLGDNRNASYDSRKEGGKSYPIKSLYGVVADWSLRNKPFFSAVHKYFYFDLPNSFGIKK